MVHPRSSPPAAPSPRTPARGREFSCGGWFPVKWAHLPAEHTYSDACPTCSHHCAAPPRHTRSLENNSRFLEGPRQAQRSSFLISQTLGRQPGTAVLLHSSASYQSGPPETENQQEMCVYDETRLKEVALVAVGQGKPRIHKGSCRLKSQAGSDAAVLRQNSSSQRKLGFCS